MIMEHIIPEASSFAGDVDSIIEMVFFITTAWLIVAEAILFYFIFKYKRKVGFKSEYIPGESTQQKNWIFIPIGLVILCDLFILMVDGRVWYEIKEFQPPPDETIRIIGQQWAWTFVHPGADGILDTADDITLVDELHVKVNSVYHFQLSSKDVLHSLSIPVFRLRQDAVPGRVITGWFKPTRVGKYNLQCTEICGIGHGIMQSDLYVETAAEHEKWLQAQPQSKAAATVSTTPAVVATPAAAPAPATTVPATVKPAAATVPTAAQ